MIDLWLQIVSPSLCFLFVFCKLVDATAELLFPKKKMPPRWVHALQTLQQIPYETNGGFVRHDCPKGDGSTGAGRCFASEHLSSLNLMSSLISCASVRR
jgi:hypothetical protein